MPGHHVGRRVGNGFGHGRGNMVGIRSGTCSGRGPSSHTTNISSPSQDPMVSHQEKSIPQEKKQSLDRLSSLDRDQPLTGFSFPRPGKTSLDRDSLPRPGGFNEWSRTRESFFEPQTFSGGKFLPNQYRLLPHFHSPNSILSHNVANTHSNLWLCR